MRERDWPGHSTERERDWPGHSSERERERERERDWPGHSSEREREAGLVIAERETERDQPVHSTERETSPVATLPDGGPFGSVLELVDWVSVDCLVSGYCDRLRYSV